MGDSIGKVEKESAEQRSRWGEWLYKTKISTEDLSCTVLQSTDPAIRSARSLQHNSSKLFQSLQDFVPQTKFRYQTYEDAFFKKVRDELASVREHPAVAGGVAVTTGLLLMRGPRRFLFRHTFGRLQNEEAQFVRADKNVKELNLSVNLMKKESRKLLERANLAEAEMKHGHTDLMAAGSQIQSLAKSLYKVEAEAVVNYPHMDFSGHEHSGYSAAAIEWYQKWAKAEKLQVDLMDVLREIPGREALKLRAEVASMASSLRQQSTTVDKRIMKISELGIRV